METYLAPFLEWLQLHPHWAGLAVFAISALESLLVVGLFVPGTVVMFGIGALVATGAMALWPTLAWAVLGAIAGDGISFMIGYHFHQRLRVMWPFYKHPALMARGVDFFHHHGGKSIIFARFVGPVRPILPAVAGMLNMPPARFFLVNILSALVWAPAYLLPGILFGASLGLAAEVAGRLALLLVVLIAVLWAGIWLVQRLFKLLQPHATQFRDAILARSRRHALLHPLAAALLDPAHPEARGMTILSVLLLAASWAFLAILLEVRERSTLANLDSLVFHSLQDLRTPFADRVMVAVTQLGDGLVLGILIAGLALWLGVRGYWKACLHWLAAAGIATLLTRAIKLGTAMERPRDLYTGVDAFSFPSSHTGMSIVVYGFLAVIIARELPPARRWLPYVMATLLCIPIAFSRLYLGAHWLSDVLGGISLALFWVALMGIAYRTHPGPAIPSGRLSALALVLLLAGSGWNLRMHYDDHLVHYQPRHPLMDIGLEEWRSGAWRELPASRQDLEGDRRHPLDLQWNGDLGRIEHWLDTQGWQRPPGLSLSTLLPEFSSDPALDILPVLPQVHDGRHDVLRRVRYHKDQQRLEVLRLWPADLRTGKNREPLWIGNVTFLEPHRIFGLLTFLRTMDDFETPFHSLQARVGEWRDTWDWSLRDRDGRPVLLIWPAAAARESPPG